MGTPATTRIANENDYIEHHTRWDGFPSEIKVRLMGLVENWEAAIENIKEKLDEDTKGTVSLKKWVTDFEHTLNNYKENPTIEMTSMLLCFHSFSHHHILPIKSTGNLLSYWGEGEPDITAQLINGELTCTVREDEYDDNDELIESTSQPLIEVVRKELSTDFKVMRIYGVDKDGSIDDDNYVDFKYKDISEEDLFTSIIHLPLFLRDIYTVTKLSRTEKEAMNRVDALTSAFQKLAEFYQPTNEYKRFGVPKKDVVRNTKARKQSIEDSLDNAQSMIPFDLDITSLGNHIALANPGKVLPVTKGERLSDYAITFKVGMYDDRNNSIYCSIPNKSEDDMKALLKETILSFDHKVHHFNHYNKVDSIGDEIQFSQLLCEEVFYGVPYEETIINLMENQYSIEINDILESK